MRPVQGYSSGVSGLPSLQPVCKRPALASRGNSLRHPFSTFQGNHGAPMPVLQSLLGHSTAKTTMVYTPSTARQPVNATGRAGIIVQSGIATDDSNTEFFADLMKALK